MKFWLIAGTLSARIEISPGYHVITEVSADGCFDSDGPDDEELARAIAGCIYHGDKVPAGYAGTDESLEAARLAADIAWDSAARCKECGGMAPSKDWLSREGWCTPCFTAKAPAWLETLRACGAL